MACNNKNCGCQDTGLTTPFPCSSPPCPNPEPCPETFSDCCVIHNGDSFTYVYNQTLAQAENVVEGPIPVVTTGFSILQGERLCDTWQRFIAYYECGNTDTQTPYGLKSKSITSSTITIGWTPVTLVDFYQVFYAPVSTGVFVSAGIVTPSSNPTITISGLTANTNYYVYVRATYQDINSCNSVSLILTTLSA